MSERFEGRFGIQQRVLPAYRAAFFERLGGACRDGLSVFAGQPGPDEAINSANCFEAAQFVAGRNLQPLSASSPFYLGWQAGLLAWLESWQPDVLVVEANPRLISTRLAVRWMHARRRPVVGWGLGAPIEPSRGPIPAALRWDRARFLRSLDGLIAYSERGAEEYRSLGVPAGRVAVAPNSAAPRPSGRPLSRPDAFDGQPVVLFIGRLQDRKRIDLLLRACAALPACEQPRLWIVGDGPAIDALRGLAGEVYPQAEFFGARHGIDLEPFFRADVFVLPGTGGLAVQEAMAHGLPVIVAEGDGTQDDLVRPANGWLVPPGDLGALVAALREAFSDVSRLRTMGLESYRIVAEEANIEKMVATFVQVGNRIMNGLEFGHSN